MLVAVLTGCTPDYTVTVQNNTGRLLYVKAPMDEGKHARTIAVAAGGTGSYAPGNTPDDCMVEELRAVTPGGGIVATTAGLCLDDTWTIEEPAPPLPRAPRLADLPALSGPPPVRVRVSLSGWQDETPWVRAADDTGARLDAALWGEHLGSARGPFEEDFGLSFYLYPDDPADSERMLEVTVEELARVPGIYSAYATVPAAGPLHRDRVLRLELAPSRRSATTTSHPAPLLPRSGN